MLPTSTRRSRVTTLIVIAAGVLAVTRFSVGWASGEPRHLASRSAEAAAEPATEPSSVPRSIAVPRSAPVIRITRGGSEFPNGGWIANRSQQFVVHLCTSATIGTSSVSSSYGQVEPDAQAICGPGENGTAYFLTYDSLLYANPLQDGPNTFTASACNAYPYDHECTYFNGLINYGGLLDPKLSATPLEPEITVRKGVTDTVAIKLMNSDTLPRALPIQAYCSRGMSNCIKLNDAFVPALGSDTVLVRFTGDSIGIGAAAIKGCYFDATTEEDRCGYGSHPVAVLPAAPVASNVAVTPTVPSTTKGQGATFSLTYRVKNTGTVQTTYALQATCPSTIVASGCTVSPSAPTINAGDSTTVTIGTMTATSPSQLTTATVALAAWAGGANATGQTAVTVGPNGGTGGTPAISVTSLPLNPQGSIARDQCLSIAAGDAAGIECGDLRLAHALPSTQTMTKGRAPTLLYLSRHAHPVLLVNADVRVLRATPATVSTTLTIPGRSPLTRSFTWPAACQNVTCRIVVPVDAGTMGLATGAYAYTLQVQMTSGSTYTATDTGTIAVVNRTTSAFGRGWWLEGLEQLVPVAGDSTRMLWVGGDGSTRLYKRIAIGSSTYLSVYPVSRPDTLVKFNSTEYRRLLPNKAYVTFSTDGRHTSTTNSQGHVTSLHHGAGGSLDSIRLPVPTGSGSRPAYGFRYTGGKLTAIRTRRGANDSLSTTISRYGADRIGSIIDPDSAAPTRFDSTSANGLIARRVSRAGHVTNFVYDSLGAVIETQVVVPAVFGAPLDTIRTQLCPTETRSLTVCTWGPASALGGVTLPAAVTRLNGPRNGLIDVMTFVVNRFGSPDTLQDPVGGRTRLQRHTGFPALVTRLTGPTGLVQRAAYNARGLVDSLIVVSPLGTADSAVTTITWHSSWALPTTVKPPRGGSTQTQYDGTWPRAQWTQTGSDATTRVTFAYDASNRISSVTQPGLTETFTYDGTLGNVSSIQAGPQTTNITRDSLGFERTVADGGNLLTETIYRNAVGRVDSTRAVSAATTRLLIEDTASGTSMVKARKQYWNTVPSRTRVVINKYDAAGNLIKVERRADGTGGATNTASEWGYDAARRVLWRKEPMGTDSFRYDPAGLQIRRRTARGHNITQEYDAAGRLIARAIPTVVHPMELCTACRKVSYPGGIPFYWYDEVRFPYFRTALPGLGESPDVMLVGDVETFSYDAAGRMLTAYNRDARVNRTYYPGGALKADTLRMRLYQLADTTAAQYGTHVFGLQFEYDLLGRRTRRTDSFGWQQTYAYSDSLGRLIRTAERLISGGDSTWFVFTHNAAGQVLTRALGTVPNGTPIVDSMRYDAYGRLIRRSARGRYASSAQLIFLDSMSYDSRGKMSWRRTDASYADLKDSVRMRYDGFGAVVAVESFREFGTSDHLMDEYDVDALGNVLASFLNRGQTEGTSLRARTYSGERLTAASADQLADMQGSGGFPAVMSLDTAFNYFDLSGGQIGTDTYKHDHHATLPAGGWGRAETGSAFARNFYDAANRLRLSQRTVDGTVRHTQIDYRYDALGRRILMRTRMDSMAVCNGATHLEPPCLSTMDRFVWDGDQLLVELRAPGGYNVAPAALETQVGTGAYFGQVRYLHAGGIDQPLSVRKGTGTAFVPHASGRGGFEAGTYVNGTEMQDYHWPARVAGVTLGADARLTAPAPIGWFGSLLDNKTDANGQLYMRNRYYDPATGRFTQQDPIGLAGGLNLYGYANGDPINLSDPFGLRADADTADRTIVVAKIAEQLGKKPEEVEAAMSSEAGMALPAGKSVVFGSGESATTITAKRGANIRLTDGGSRMSATGFQVTSPAGDVNVTANVNFGMTNQATTVTLNIKKGIVPVGGGSATFGKGILAAPTQCAISALGVSVCP